MDQGLPSCDCDCRYNCSGHWPHTKTSINSSGSNHPCQDSNSFQDVFNIESLEEKTKLFTRRKGGRPRSKTPTEETMKSRRRAANARERRRMDRMNAAYIRLREALPGHQDHVLLSKKQTVQQALQYIAELEKLLGVGMMDNLMEN